MRTWHIDLIPFLCSKHLVGVHGEIHKHRYCFVKQHKMDGRVGQVDFRNMKKIHDLAASLLKNHNSPYEMPDISYLAECIRESSVDYEKDKEDLIERCKKCRENIKKWKKEVAKGNR